MKYLPLLPVLLLLSWFANGDEYQYKNIAQRHSSVALDDAQLSAAQMQGECLVGLKAITFKRKSEFDPVAEWTNFRAFSLLEQFSPCEVLVMMEVAQPALRRQQQGSAP